MEVEDYDNQFVSFWVRKEMDYKAVPSVEAEDLNTLYFCLDLSIKLLLKVDLYFDYCTSLKTFIYYI